MIRLSTGSQCRVDKSSKLVVIIKLKGWTRKTTLILLMSGNEELCFLIIELQLVGSHSSLDFPCASSDLEDANLRIARYLWVEGYVNRWIICIEVVGQPIELDYITNRKDVVGKNLRSRHWALRHAKYHLCGSRRFSSNAHSVLQIRQIGPHPLKVSIGNVQAGR